MIKNKNINYIIIMAAIGFIWPMGLNARNSKLYTVKGIVLDARTNKPLYFANVFLNNTSLGTATDKRGRFTISGIPAGRYQIVASYMGYKLKKKDIEIGFGEDIRKQKFLLEPVVINAPALIVSAKRDPSWGRNLRRFTRLFLGTSELSLKCKIENPEVLDFTKGKDVLLKATAERPLKIINNGLGYKITYYLDEFYALREGDVTFTGDARFSLIHPQDMKDSLRICKNRRRAYNGSLAHFLHSFIQKRLRKEGFEVDTLAGSPFSGSRVYLNKVNVDSFGRSVINIGEVEIFLPRWMRVSYKNEYESLMIIKSLKDQFGNKEDGEKQISYLNIESRPLMCSPSGYPYLPQFVIRYGHMAFDRMAEMLPMDYEPGIP